MPTRRTILESLTRKDLLDLAKAFDIAGLTAQLRADIVAGWPRVFTTEDLLGRFSRNQFKAACQAAGLPDNSREKQLLMNRLLSGNGQSSPAQGKAAATAVSKSHASTQPHTEKPMAKHHKSNGSTTVTSFRHCETKRKNNPPAKLAAEGTVPRGSEGGGRLAAAKAFSRLRCAIKVAGNGRITGFSDSGHDSDPEMAFKVNT